jgi:hypothetical protein
MAGQCTTQPKSEKFVLRKWKSFIFCTCSNEQKISKPIRKFYLLSMYVYVVRDFRKRFFFNETISQLTAPLIIGFSPTHRGDIQERWFSFCDKLVSRIKYIHCNTTNYRKTHLLKKSCDTVPLCARYFNNV